MANRTETETFIKVFTNGQTFYADTVARTAVYGADLCKFEEAYWYDGSERSKTHAKWLTNRVLKIADQKLADMAKAGKVPA